MAGELLLKMNQLQSSENCNLSHDIYFITFPAPVCRIHSELFFF